MSHLIHTFNTANESHVNTLPFTAHKEKDYPYFCYNYTIKVKNKKYLTPNASQVINFPIQPILPLTFETSEKLSYLLQLLVPISTVALTLLLATSKFIKTLNQALLCHYSKC